MGASVSKPCSCFADSSQNGAVFLSPPFVQTVGLCIQRGQVQLVILRRKTVRWFVFLRNIFFRNSQLHTDQLLRLQNHSKKRIIDSGKPRIHVTFLSVPGTVKLAFSATDSNPPSLRRNTPHSPRHCNNFPAANNVGCRGRHSSKLVPAIGVAAVRKLLMGR